MYTNKTLSQLLTIDDEVIRRNALSILKRFQECEHERKMLSSDHPKAGMWRECTVCGIIFPERMK